MQDIDTGAVESAGILSLVTAEYDEDDDYEDDRRRSLVETETDDEGYLYVTADSSSKQIVLVALGLQAGSSFSVYSSHEYDDTTKKIVLVVLLFMFLCGCCLVVTGCVCCGYYCYKKKNGSKGSDRSRR